MRIVRGRARRSSGGQEGGAPGVSRRHFLGASGAFGAAALAPGRVRGVADAVVGRERTDVVVVGGGVAGLVAARELRRAGASVVVLEAGGHAGGRAVPTDPAGGLSTVEVPASHEAVLALARDLGVRTRPVEAGGDTVVEVLGARRVVSGDSLSGDAGLDREVGVALRSLNLMAAEVDPAVPWAADNARDRDGVALASWVSDNVESDAGRAFLTVLSRAVWAAEPSEISLLHALATVSGAGGMGPLVNAALVPGWAGPELRPVTGDGGPSHLCRSSRLGGRPLAIAERAQGTTRAVAIDGGAAALVEALTDELAAHIRNGVAVRSIAQPGGGAVTVVADGLTIEAERVVVALPPGAASRLAFEPSLPAEHAGLRRLAGGEVVSVVCAYGWALGNRDGWLALVASTVGPLTLARAYRRDGGAFIVAHACGSAARRLAELPDVDRRRTALDALRAWFGADAGSPRTYAEHDWRAGVSGGAGWSVVAHPGAVTSLMPALRAPVGRVHWAGTERATAWPGWLEGAVRSGVQAADEVVGQTSPLGGRWRA